MISTVCVERTAFSLCRCLFDFFFAFGSFVFHLSSVVHFAFSFVYRLQRKKETNKRLCHGNRWPKKSSVTTVKWSHHLSILRFTFRPIGKPRQKKECCSWCHILLFFWYIVVVVNRRWQNERHYDAVVHWSHFILCWVRWNVCKSPL